MNNPEHAAGTAQLDAYDTSGTSPPRSSITCFEAARLYRAHHLVPIPLVAGAKRPLHENWNSDARPPFAQAAKDWLTRRAGVGIVTGRPGGARIIVVDVDVKGAKKGDPTRFHGTTPCVARTPSGGWHFYYRDDRAPEAPDIRNLVGVLPGVDVRADGGQVAAWPTRTAEGSYRWEGKAALACLLAGTLPGFSTVRHLLAPPGDAGESGREEMTEAWVSEALRRRIPMGEQRDQVVRVAGYFISKRLPVDIATETLWKWVSTFEMRRDDPWTREHVRDIVTDLERKDRERTAANGRRHEGEVAETVELFQSADRASFPEVDWIVPDFVPLGGLVEIIGKVKKGKSTLTFQLAHALIKGVPFLDRAVPNRSPVVLLTEQCGVSLKKTLERAGLLGEPDLYLVTKPQLRRRSWSTVVAAAIQKAKDVGARLIVVDTLSRITMLTGDGENSSGAANIFDPCGPAREAGIAILFVRHARKGTPGVADDGADMGRGTTAITGEMDITMRLRPVPGADLRELTWDSRISDDPEPITLHYESGRYEVVMADAGKPLDPEAETPSSRLQKLADLEAQGITGFAEQRRRLGWAKDTLANYRKIRAAQRAAGG